MPRAARHVPVAGPPEALLEHVPPGADVIVPLANGEPPGLLDVLEANADALEGVRIHQMHPLRERDYMHGRFGDRLRHVSYFLSAANRKAYWNGTCDLVANNFSEMPALLRSATRCTLVIAASTPPDRHGYFSLGTNADYVASLIGRVPFFLEANPRMPYTSGENTVHVSQVAGWTEAEHDLGIVAPVEPSEMDHRIASFIAERIPDGATLQVGIGGIPTATLTQLREHRDLGIHTELMTDGIMDLIDSGAVTGTRKRHRRNKHDTTFCLGTQRLYDWLHLNEGVELLPVDWMNDPRIIAREPHFVSINATTEIDLYGQCASETVAGRYWSSSGGQADFARGAMYSDGGKAFVVLHSQTKKGRSRIRSQLTPGSVVTTLKNTVDHVVTEHGLVELRGKSMAERARLLISIAHPDHREHLEREARELGQLR